MAATSPIAQRPVVRDLARLRSTTIRPPRPVGTPGTAATGFACTPAAQHEGVRREVVAVAERRPGCSWTRATCTPVRTSTPALDQRFACVTSRDRAERCEQLVAHLDEHDPGPVDVDAAMVVAQHHLEQLGEGTGHFDTGRSATHHHEGQRAVVDHRRIRVGGLETLEHVVPQALGVDQVVQREAVLIDPRDGERVGDRTGGHDQMIERQVGHRVIVVVQMQATDCEVGADDGGVTELEVGLAALDAPDRVRDVGARQARGGHLVEQGLEGVEVVAVDEGDIDRRVGELAGRDQTTEACADDHDARPARR